MNMKRFYALLLTAVMVLSLTACGGKKTETSGTTTAAPETSGTTTAAPETPAEVIEIAYGHGFNRYH